MSERRRRSRKKATGDLSINISIERAGGSEIAMSADLIDSSDWGIGIESSSPMVVGAVMSVWGPGLPNAETRETARRVHAVHCRTVGERRFRVGCAFEDAPANGPEEERGEMSMADYYETLQVSPTADHDTIHRIYRILAQRYHPDNPETGNQSAFQAVLTAYQTLSDPEKRAAYDVRYQASKSLRWEIFEKPADVEGVEIQKRMRAGILSALYSLRVKAPDAAGITIRELEDLLGCPREHMEFPMWFLRRKGFVEPGENGRFSITVEGCEAAEAYQADGLAPVKPRMKELPAPDDAVAAD